MPPDMPTWEVLFKWGFGATMAIAVVYMFWYMLQYMLKQWSAIFNQYQQMLKTSLDANTAWEKAMNEHTQQAKEFHLQMAEAARVQAESHERMIRLIADASAQHEKIMRAVDTVCDKIGRQ